MLSFPYGYCFTLFVCKELISFDRAFRYFTLLLPSSLTQAVSHSSFSSIFIFVLLFYPSEMKIIWKVVWIFVSFGCIIPFSSHPKRLTSPIFAKIIPRFSLWVSLSVCKWRHPPNHTTTGDPHKLKRVCIHVYIWR